MLSAIANKGEILKPQILKKEKEIIKKIFLPSSIRNTILKGMNQTVWGEKGTARPSIIKKLRNDPDLKNKYLNLKDKMIGKTSTAEIMCKLDITSEKAEKYKDIWFGGIYFEDEENPEIVVVVYLRFGDGGKEAAPLASEIIHKYKELKDKHSKN
jgi:cell division protein FtsI/penicillin-binding protein 2